MLIGVVSDTHGWLDSRLIEAFEGVEAILHAGDVGSEAVLEGLRLLAPVYAVQGNNDVPLGGLGLLEHLDIDFASFPVHVVHELPHARPQPETRVVVFGHSHRQVWEWREGVLYLNPGAAGRRGFHALQTAALLRIEAGVLAVEELVLGPRQTTVRGSATRPSRASG
ncbi:MAG TPA: metallophosphoesterase family protein [Dehalococcoidia bacterium]|nr:metallophosphoesterase family protein [Dehalococcoidia bacterium]